MKTTLKIKQLWRYLKIQDNEILIVQSYNRTKSSNEFIVTEMVDGVLQTHTIDGLQAFDTTKPFRLIQQLDCSGKHTIPSVKQLKYDEFADY